jgi:bacillopeptidase F
MKRIYLFFVFFCFFPPSLHARIIGPRLQSTLKSISPDDKIPLIITFADKVDFKLFDQKNKNIRRTELIKSLKSKAEYSQRSIKAYLKSKGIGQVKPLWIINGISVSLQAGIIAELIDNPEIENIRLDDRIREPKTVRAVLAAPEWNLNAVNAPGVWDLGHTGEGAVVAVMDTGVDLDHPDLGDKWRGGSNSWFDPNGEHNTPYDKNGHGTQVMGVIVGGDSGGTAIGMAPGAKWIAVKIFDDMGEATYSDIHSGFQWLLDPDGIPATDDAPDVVNNSWNFIDTDLCLLEFRADIQALHTAGISVVFSAGNEGPSLNSSVSPSNYPESFAVGAVNNTLGIAGFSSRGPSACDGTIYPQVVAPGVSIRTSDLTMGGGFPNSYATLSGTSYAAPHVTGAAALLISAFDGITAFEIEEVLKQSTKHTPDNNYGYGLIDVLSAYNILINPTVCTDTDGDGYFAEVGCSPGMDCDDNDATIHPLALEIKHDGVDQDCNGYDLTIEILRVDYKAKKNWLQVKATSDLGEGAQLEMVGYGPMIFHSKKSEWGISVRGFSGNSGNFTVSGTEGSVVVELK